MLIRVIKKLIPDLTKEVTITLKSGLKLKGVLDLDPPTKEIFIGLISISRDLDIISFEETFFYTDEIASVSYIKEKMP